MVSWRVAGAWLLLAAVVPSVGAQTAPLVEALKPGDCFRFGIDLKLSGQLRIRKDSGPATLDLTATANHAFGERVLAAEGTTAQKVVRTYESASVAIKVGSDSSERSLRPGRRLVVAQRHKDQRLVYSPAGALYRGEIEAVEHFDTLALAAALPGREVKVGDTWKVPAVVAQALCNIEGVSDCKIEGKLTGVVVDEAVFTLTGTVAGVDQGAQVKSSVEATGTFDLKRKRLTKLQWKQKDDRDQGPVSPASTMELTVTLTRKPIEMPADLNDVATVSVPKEMAPPAEMTHVEYRDAKGRFSLLHAREWQLTAVTADHTVLRLVERGDFLAQATVTPWKKAKKGEHLSPDDFKTAMHNTSGWRPERELQAGVVPTTDGKYVYRLSVVGQLDGVQVLQNFFLIANAEGDQVVLTFTLSPKNADKIGARDLSMAGSLEVPAPVEKK